MYLILFVLNKPELLEEVLAAWEQAGVSGATVLMSTGLGRLRQEQGLRDDLPLMPGMEDFYRHEADTSRTLFTMVDSDRLVRKVVQATGRVVGDLDQPGNGILAVLPVAEIHGLIKRSATRKTAG